MAGSEALMASGVQPFIISSDRFFSELKRGPCSGRRGPLKHSASVDLFLDGESCAPVAAGNFSSECLGMFNSSEISTLRLLGKTVEYTRAGNLGEWKVDGINVASNRIGFVRRQMYWGRSTTIFKDSKRLEVRMPVLGPSTYARRCAGHAVFDSTKITLLFQSKVESGTLELMFENVSSEVAKSLSVIHRLVLLGEFLRARTGFLIC